MTDADRAAYKRAFEIAKRSVPRGHQISWASWRDGRLSTMTSPIPKAEKPPATPRTSRGARAQANLFGD